MATLTKEQIEQLQQELKQKIEEIKVINGKLLDAGVIPMSDDYLDEVTGGLNPPSTIYPDGLSGTGSQKGGRTEVRKALVKPLPPLSFRA